MRPYENSGLGYSDRYNSDLYRYLKSRKYSDQVLRETGLFNADEKKGMYDKFWNRVIYPLWTPTAASSVSEAASWETESPNI